MWGTPEIEKIGKMLSGSWKTTAPVNQQNPAAGKIDVWMHIVPMAVQGLDGTMYVENARSDAPHRPYRQAIFQLYSYKGKARLRTYEFRNRDTGGMVGLWLAPQYLPQIAAGELIATIDIDISPSGKGYAGKSPYPFPTGVGGAVEMTSELQLTDDTIVTEDRGFDATGKIVWGSSENDSYTFKKTAPASTADVRDNGLIVISMVPGTGEKKIARGDRVSMHYTGWLANGKLWDTSRNVDRPLMYNQGAGMVAGLTQGMEGAGLREVRRLVIPWDLGYGAAGYRNVPPYTNLIIETEVMSIETPETPPGPPPQAPTPPAPAGEPPAPAPAPK